MPLLNKRFSLLFYLKKGKDSKGARPVYLRITVDGKRTELSTKIECEPGKWNPAAGRAKGTKEESRALNAYLDLLQARVGDVQHQLLAEGKPATGDLIKNK